MHCHHQTSCKPVSVKSEKSLLVAETWRGSSVAVITDLKGNFNKDLTVSNHVIIIIY